MTKKTLTETYGEELALEAVLLSLEEGIVYMCQAPDGTCFCESAIDAKFLMSDDIILEEIECVL